MQLFAVENDGVVGRKKMSIVGEDDEDIEILLRECDLHSAKEALDLLARMYPLQEPPPKTRFFLEELFGSK